MHKLIRIFFVIGACLFVTGIILVGTVNDTPSLGAGFMGGGGATLLTSLRYYLEEKRGKKKR
ncbi:MAG: hypothetical protein IJQ17_06325 [Oscillospiraceae bacterium]|nr:hypothetical protein [Oscillospiraceae bacterium]